MFRFAANLNMLFGEYAFRDRFAAAYHAGFSAVELLHPYAEPVEHLKEWLIASRLECVLINTPFSPEGGDAGCAAIAGREHDFFRKIHLALSYARALSVPTVHVMAGDAERSLEAGMDGHVPKPIDPTVLFDTLCAWLPVRDDIAETPPQTHAPAPPLPAGALDTAAGREQGRRG